MYKKIETNKVQHLRRYAMQLSDHLCLYDESMSMSFVIILKIQVTWPLSRIIILYN